MPEQQEREERSAPEEAMEEAPPKRTRRPPSVPVSVIASIGQSAIVQWMEGDDYHKSTIPASEVQDGHAHRDVLEAGEDPFTWESAGLRPISVEEQAQALRKARIFDPDDFGSDPNRAIGAIQRLINRELTRIIKEHRHA